MRIPHPDPKLAPVLLDNELKLRPACDADVSARLRLGRVPEIARMFAMQSKEAERPLTEDEARRWVDRLAANPYGWVVEYDGELLGEAFLHGVDPVHGEARFACGLYDPERLGKGIGRRVVRLVLAYGFENLELHRIGLRVIAYNERAIRCYRACGFQEEGRLREAVLMDGERCDDILMGILRREYETSAAIFHRGETTP